MGENDENLLIVKMEVIVHSTLSSIGGQVTVATDPNQRIDSLITAFCMEKNIQHRRDYILRDRDRNILDNTHTLSSARVYNGDILFLGIREGSEKSAWVLGCSPWWVLASVALFIGAMGLAAVSIIRVEGSVQPDAYGIVMDAGSSHTQLYVYRWPANKVDGTGVVQQDLDCRAKGNGISQYVDDPTQAGDSLKACLDEAVERVPSSDHAATPVFLGATAGMRLLRDSDNVTHSDSAVRILESVRATIATYPFNFTFPKQQARILEGQEEGAFGWVTVNFLNGTFGDLTTQLKSMFLGPSAVVPVSLGAMDLGGASTQMTFNPKDSSATPPSYMEDLKLYGAEYSVYTHSYLCYGMNEAYRQFLAHLVQSQGFPLNVTNPCGAVGASGNATSHAYTDIFELPCTLDKPTNDSHKNDTFTFIGSSNSDECKKSVSEIFNFSTPCTNSPCTFDGVHQPAVYGEYLAFSGFYYLMNFLGLASKQSTLEQFEKATTEFCLKNWTEIITAGGATPDKLLKYCFHAHYIHTLLIDAYKFDTNTWNSITFTNTTGNTPTTLKPDTSVDLGWSLGFMLNTSNILPVEGPHPSISLTLFVLLLLLFIVFIGLAVGFGYHARQNTDAAIRKRYNRMSSYGAV